jgi:hypothetical protein
MEMRSLEDLDADADAGVAVIAWRKPARNEEVRVRVSSATHIE